MHIRTRSRLAVLPLAAALLVGAAACGGDDSSSTKDDDATTTVVTTEAPTTLPPVTVPATVTPITLPVTEAPTTDPVIVPEFIDPAELLTPWDGIVFQSVSQESADSLITSLMNSASDEAPVTYAGAVDAIAADGTTSKLLFIEFGIEFTPDLSQEFVDGVTETASDIVEIDANGLPGYAFIDADGTYGFVSLRPTTAVVVMSPTEDALMAAVDGLFTANAEL